jgi:hypothetical protein
MSIDHCPHCGRINFRVIGWVDLDRCARCGKPLANQDLRAARDRVQERMFLRPLTKTSAGDRKIAKGKGDR